MTWFKGYDDWKTTDLNDRWLGDDDREEGCTCCRALVAGGRRKTERNCPVHGIDPDEAYERRRDERDDR